MSITLTVAEIRDLALFCGFRVDDNGEEKRGSDELDTEIVIEACEKGIQDDDGKVLHYSHIAWFSEYPDEGVMGLGPEIHTPDRTAGMKG